MIPMNSRPEVDSIPLSPWTVLVAPMMNDLNFALDNSAAASCQCQYRLYRSDAGNSNVRSIRNRDSSNRKGRKNRSTDMGDKVVDRQRPKCNIGRHKGHRHQCPVFDDRNSPRPPRLLLPPRLAQQVLVRPAAD